VYTVSLGLSELLANFSFIGEFEIARALAEEPVVMDSVIPEKGTRITFERDKEYFTQNSVVWIARELSRSRNVIYERNGSQYWRKPNTISGCKRRKGPLSLDDRAGKMDMNATIKAKGLLRGWAVALDHLNKPPVCACN